MLFYIKLLWVATAFLPGLVFSTKSPKRHQFQETHNHGVPGKSIRNPHHQSKDATQQTGTPSHIFNVYNFLDSQIPRVEAQRKPPNPVEWTDEFAAIWLIDGADERNFVYQPVDSSRSNTPVINAASQVSPASSTTAQNYMIARPVEETSPEEAMKTKVVSDDALTTHTGTERVVMYTYVLPSTANIAKIKSIKDRLAPGDIPFTLAYTRPSENADDVVQADASLGEGGIQMIHKEYALQSEI